MSFCKECRNVPTKKLQILLCKDQKKDDKTWKINYLKCKLYFISIDKSRGVMTNIVALAPKRIVTIISLTLIDNNVM